LVVLIVVCAGLIVALGVAVVLNLTGDQAQRELQRYHGELARATADSISQRLMSLLDDMADATFLCDLSTAPSDADQALQRLHEREAGEFLGVFRLDAAGEIKARYPDEAGAVQSCTECHAARRATDLSKTKSGVFRCVPGTEAIAVIVPVRGGGAVCGLLDSSYIRRNYLERLASGFECEVLLLDDAQGLIAQASSLSSDGEMRLTRSHIFGKAEGNGVQLTSAPVSLPGSPWTLLVKTSAGHAYLVKSPLLVVSLAGTRALALSLTGILFLLLNKHRIETTRENEKLKKRQDLLSQIEETEERYRTLVENLMNPMIIFQGTTIKFANKMFYALSGYSPEEIASQDFSVYSLLHEEDLPSVLENLGALRDGRTIEQPREVRFVKKSGETMNALVFSSLIRYEGEPAIESVAIDITPIKNMERELSATKERLQYLLDNAPVMIFSLDSQARFSYANAETLRVTGYSYDDWLGKSFAPIVHPDDLTLAISKFEEGRKGIPRRDYNLRIKHASGNLRTLHIVASTIRKEGQFEGSLIIAQDITEQQLLQEAVKEARNHLANIIANAGDAIITLDDKGIMVSWNRAAEAMFHLSDSELNSRSVLSLLDFPEMPSLLERVMRGETVRDREIEQALPGDARLDALFTLSPIRNASGKIVGSSCIAKDITQRRRLERQLDVEKQFIDRLIENANAFIAATDNKGRLVIFNRLFEEATGFKKKEVLGKDPLSFLIPEQYREEAHRRMSEVRAGKPLLEAEAPILSKNGHTLIIRWNAADVKLPNGSSATILVGRDVTEQKRMHEELIQSKKLAAVGELVSGVAHELNNPLTIVMGYSQLLTGDQTLGEKHRDMANKILEGAARSKRIVENLLAFARKKKLQKHAVNINEIIENTLTLREHNLAVNDVTIIRRYEPGLPPTYADAHQLQQVFLNLINNAFDSMYSAHRGGTLEVATRLTDGWIQVEVIDDGPGVPESIQDKIFDPFFTTKEVGKGTGLGMSLSYGIVKEHGGKIRLDSAFRDGAKFVVEIPLTPVPAGVQS
jgi:PAS domain S-box-containing protein